MADREIINVGSTVDDGTGDLLRNAFQKVNNNFDQIWTKTTVNSNLSVSEFSISSDGDLILTPADEVKIAKSIIINSDKGNYDTTIHGETLDNILFVDASAGRVGILNNTPTTTLDVTGNVNVSNTLTTMALNTTGHTVLGDDIADTVTFNARVNSSFQPYGNQTLGLLTNRWQNAYLQNLDVSGVISGTLTGGLDPSIVISNDINNTTIETTALDVNGSTELDDVLITGNLVVQGTTTTLETTEVLVDNAIVFEGATADDYETTITVADPTQDNTITFQDASGTVAFLSDVTASAGLQSGDNVSELTNDAGYLTSYTETDPVFSASAASGIVTGDITNWNTAFGWGDHSTAGYSTFDGQYSSLIGAPTIPADVSDLTDTTSLLVHFDGDYNSLTNQPTIPADVSDLTDTTSLLVHFDGDYNSLTNQPTIPTVPTAVSSFTNDSGYITDYTVTESDVTAHQSALSITESQISDFGSYITSVEDEPTFTIQTASFTAALNKRYGIDTTTSAVTVTLPASASAGDTVYFADAGGNYATNNLTIDRSSYTIMDSTSNLIVSTNNESFGLLFNGSTWRLY